MVSKASVRKFTVVAACLCMLGITSAWAQVSNNCASLPDNSALHSALVSAVSTETSGFNLNMWATIVARDGTVCAVAFSGTNSGSQWLGSRVISAQKANTANAFSLDASSSSNSSGVPVGLVLSTANLYTAVQPGGSLFGLQESNPVDAHAAYDGVAASFGTIGDPMVGHRIGGINVFGGGLALYATTSHTLVGGVGVSGDSSCADHMIAWRVRNLLHLDHLLGVAGVSGDPSRPDNIVFDITKPGNSQAIEAKSASGWGHPTCANTANPSTLPAVQN